MIISSSRLQVLKSTLAAWNKTGFPFLTLENGIIAPIENSCADDPGLNYFVPYVAKIFNLSLEQALWWWDCGLVFVGALIAISGFWYLAKTKLEKVIATIAVVGVSFVCWSVGDVYIAPFFNVCLLPWLFVVLQKNNVKKIILWAFCAGLVVAFTNAFRMHAGWTLAVAGIVAVIFFTKNIKKIILFFLAMIAGVGVFQSYFTLLMHQRNTYLTSQHIPYGSYELKHVLWHSTYLGLGFLQNEYGIRYGDDCALQKAQSIYPEIVYCSTEYNQLLKQEVVSFCVSHPHFLLRTLFAKFGVLFYYFLLFANVGLIGAWFYKKPWHIELSYFVALAFSSLSALATIPIAPYLTGFFAVATFYGIHSTLWALQQGLSKELKLFFSRFF